MVYLPVSECEHLNKLSSITIMAVFVSAPLCLGLGGSEDFWQDFALAFLTLDNCVLPAVLFIYLD